MVLIQDDSPTIGTRLFNAGMDDGIKLPPDPDELHARVQAVALRSRGASSTMLCSGYLTFDNLAREARLWGRLVKQKWRYWKY